MQNAIYLRHALRVIVPEGNDPAPPAYTATFLKNIEALGFTGDAALIDRLRRLSPIQIALFYADVLPILQTMVGAHHIFAPMYPKFPQQVMEASRVELYINALLHYITHSLPPDRPRATFASARTHRLTGDRRGRCGGCPAHRDPAAVGQNCAVGHRP